jgi:hypothetical protein
MIRERVATKVERPTGMLHFILMSPPRSGPPKAANA